jgi:hypothetical protein
MTKTEERIDMEESEINIETRTIEVPIKIEIKGKKFPITERNINVVREYWTTKDVRVLGKLIDISLELF